MNTVTPESGAGPPGLPDAARLRPAPPLWPFLLALSAVAGLAELAFIIVNVSALPVYLEFGLGLPKLVGYSLGAFYLAEALGNSPMGALGDRYGRRRLMVTGALISVGTCIGTAFLRVPEGGGPMAWLGIGLLITLRVLDGLGAAALWPTLFASVSDRVPPARQAQAMSVLNITYFVGIALGPFVGGLVNDTFGKGLAANNPDRYAPSFFVAAACFAVAALVAYFVAPRREDTHRHAADPDHHDEVLGEMGPAATHDAHAPTFSLAAIKRAAQLVPMLMLLSFFTFLAIGLIAPYVKLFAMKRFQISESAFGTLLLYPALLIAAIAVPLGRVTDWWGTSRSIHLGMAVCALSLWTMLILRSEWGIVVLGGLLGTGFVLAFPAYMAYIADSAGPSERGGIIGAVRMSQGIGAMFGTAVAPLIYKLDAEHLILFYTAAALLTAAAILSLLYVRDRERPGRDDSGGKVITASAAVPVSGADER